MLYTSPESQGATLRLLVTGHGTRNTSRPKPQATPHQSQVTGPGILYLEQVHDVVHDGADLSADLNLLQREDHVGDGQRPGGAERKDVACNHKRG